MENNTKETTEPRYAGFWLRLLALILDGMVINAVFTFIYIIMGKERSFLSGSVAFGSFSGNPEIYIMQLVQWLYYILMLKYFGASLGKMALKMRVVSKNGGELDWVSIILRETVGKFLSGLILGIGYLMVAWNPKKQALHDQIAGSYVILE
ncbi:MAG: RDD family protein [bacterium ADurb.Bin212]|nr:MAG: RDD family protein [bacterium ADurb.Bin212]